MTPRHEPLLASLAMLAREEEREIERLLGDWSPPQEGTPTPVASNEGELPPLNERLYALARQGLNAPKRSSVVLHSVPAVDVAGRRRPRRHRSWRLLLPSLVAGPLVVAAGLLLWWRTPVTTELPSYEALVTGGEAASRAGGAPIVLRTASRAPGPEAAKGAPDEFTAAGAVEALVRTEGSPRSPVRLAADGELDLILRPRADLASPIAAELFTQVNGRAVAPSTISTQIAPSGAVRVVTSVARLFPGTHGPVTLIVLLKGAGAHVTADASGGLAWRRLAIPFVIADP